MPLVESSYCPPLIFRQSDLSTIFASTLRRVALPVPNRERVYLEDGDFIDLDWNYQVNLESKKVAILLHGLGGNSQRPYMKGMARAFLSNGWDIAAVNLRGCSEEPNRLFRSYHAGASEDLDEIIAYIQAKNKYKTIGLIGFSLGGNMVLKYLGEDRNFPKEIRGAVAISVPCDLAGSLEEINRMRNLLYSKRFEMKLKSELLNRAQQFPDQLNVKKVDSCRSLRDIDEIYTSKAHGFLNADDYYLRNSSLNFLGNIQYPTLLINARNDSFLCSSSYPVDEANNSSFLHLQTPLYGGHVGFVLPGYEYYHEREATQFFKQMT